MRATAAPQVGLRTRSLRSLWSTCSTKSRASSDDARDPGPALRQESVRGFHRLELARRGLACRGLLREATAHLVGNQDARRSQVRRRGRGGADLGQRRLDRPAGLEHDRLAFLFDVLVWFICGRLFRQLVPLVEHEDRVLVGAVEVGVPVRRRRVRRRSPPVRSAASAASSTTNRRSRSAALP